MVSICLAEEMCSQSVLHPGDMAVGWKLQTKAQNPLNSHKCMHTRAHARKHMDMDHPKPVVPTRVALGIWSKSVLVFTGLM